MSKALPLSAPNALPTIISVEENALTTHLATVILHALLAVWDTTWMPVPRANASNAPQSQTVFPAMQLILQSVFFVKTVTMLNLAELALNVFQVALVVVALITVLVLLTATILLQTLTELTMVEYKSAIPLVQLASAILISA